MHYDFIAIADSEVPPAVDPNFQHVITTYASETNKTASVWRAVPDDLLDFKPHEKTNPVRTIMVHQFLSEPAFSTSSWARKNRPSRNCFLSAISRPSAPTSTSTFGWRRGGCRSWRRVPPP